MPNPTTAQKKDYLDTLSEFWGGSILQEFLGDYLPLEAGAKALGFGGILVKLIQALATDGDWKAVVGIPKESMFELIRVLLIKQGLSKTDADGFTNYLQGVQVGVPLIDWILKGVVLFCTGAKIAFAVMDVVDQAINKLINKKAKLQTGDFASLFRASTLSGNANEFNVLYPELGLNDSWRKAMELAQRAIINPNEAGELLRRGVIKTEDFANILGLNQYQDKNDIAKLVLLTKQILPIEVAIEQEKRKGIGRDNAIKAIEKFGYSNADAASLLDMAKPILGMSEIMPLFYKGYLTEPEAKDKLSRLGYQDEDIRKLVNVGRPQIDINALFQLRWRDFIGDDTFLDSLRRLGYTDANAQNISKIIWQPAPPSDTIRFAVREVYSPEIAKAFGQFDDFPEAFAKEAKKVGIDRQTALNYWAAHWQLPAPGQGYDMYHRGIISKDELASLLRALDVMPYWREKMIKLSDNLITRRQLRELLATGTETAEQVSDRYFKLGFSKEDSDTLTRLDEAKLRESEKDITRADAIAAYAKRYINDSELNRWLQDLGYSTNSTLFYMAEAERRRYLEDKKAELNPNENVTNQALANLTADILDQYEAGMISRDIARANLFDLDYNSFAIDYFLAHSDLKVFKSDMTFFSSNTKRMFDADAIDATETQRLLQLRGFELNAISRLIDKWSYEKYADAVVKAVKPAEPTKAEFKKWVIKGIASVDEYNNYLANKGYDEYTRVFYLTELMVDMQEEE